MLWDQKVTITLMYSVNHQKESLFCSTELCRTALSEVETLKHVAILAKPQLTFFMIDILTRLVTSINLNKKDH